MTIRMRLVSGVGLTLVLVALSRPAAAAPPGAPVPRVRIAVAELQVEGGAPTLVQQLTDGFVLGLLRAGLQVVDPAEMAKKLEGHAELLHCDASPCFKAIGLMLEVRYLVTVRVDVAGNSYKTVARVFSTEGAAPAALPVATKSKTCDVCTVTEARESMGRLADILRPNIEEAATPTAPVVAPRVVQPASRTVPVVAAMVGALAFAAGLAVLSSNPSCSGSTCSENRTRNVVGGALIGAGATFAVLGTYVTVVRSRGAEPVTGVAVAFNF
jgi:hypothetical protein